MSVESINHLRALHRYDKASRFAPFFVYMALCQDGEGPIYVKVGYSHRPDRRMYALKAGMPIPLHQFYICEIGSKQKTKIVESALHLGLSKWAISGEWFRLAPEDKQEFNRAWQSVFAQQSTSVRKLAWERAASASIKAAADRVKALYFKRLLRRTRISALRMITGA